MTDDEVLSLKTAILIKMGNVWEEMLSDDYDKKDVGRIATHVMIDFCASTIAALMQKDAEWQWYETLCDMVHRMSKDKLKLLYDGGVKYHEA